MILSPYAAKKTKTRYLTIQRDIDAIHGNKYLYHKVILRRMGEKVLIVCPKHGAFSQHMSAHLSGKGCSMCGKEEAAKAKTKSSEYYIDKADKIHGGIYKYFKDEITKSSSNTRIVCPVHGEFIMSMSRHIDSKQGCPRCGREKSDISTRLTTADFIAKSRITHGNRYDYSDTIYVKQVEKVSIRCVEHGVFKQYPNAHYFHGTGCPVCSAIGAFDLESSAFVYAIKFNSNNVYKVGITNDLKKRLYHYRDFSIVASRIFNSGKDAKTMEFSILKSLKEYKYNGTRFIERGFTELLVGDMVGDKITNILHKGL